MSNSEEILSNISIHDDRKFEVIMSVMNSVRRHITDWHNRAYTSTTWSISIMIAVGVFCLQQDDLSIVEQAFFVVSITVFLVLNHIYLDNVKMILKDNGQVLVNCETALKLNEDQVYLISKNFFDKSDSGEWIPPKDIPTLSYLHFFVGFLVILSVIFFN